MLFTLKNTSLSLSDTSAFSLSITLLCNPSLRSTAQSYRPHPIRHLLQKNPLHRFFFFADHPSFSLLGLPISLSTPLLSATLSFLYLHYFTHPTHSRGPLAHARTAFTLRYGFALFSKISSFGSSPNGLHRCLPAQLYKVQEESSSSEYFYRSDHPPLSPLFAPPCSFFIASIFSVSYLILVVNFSVLCLPIPTHFTQREARFAHPIPAISLCIAVD